MYLAFYGFREEPFGSTPDPRFLFGSAMHREAVASLQYCVETGRGFFGLIAPPGMGKTTLLFQAMEKYRDTASTAFLFNTQCNSREFVRFLLSEVGIESETDDVVRLHRRFNEFLLANSRLGRRFILMVDEAQNLTEDVLETIRLLSDFETSRAKLMQIVLAGQPELDATLKKPSMSQLLQRISMISRIDPFTAEETGNYITHRLKVAGYRGEPIFTNEAVQLIARHSHGIPRLINSICFNALSLGFAEERKQIDVDLITEAVQDLPYYQSGPLVERINTPAFTPASNVVIKPKPVAAVETRRSEPSAAAATVALPRENSVPQSAQVNAPEMSKSQTAVSVLSTISSPVAVLPFPSFTKAAAETLPERKMAQQAPRSPSAKSQAARQTMQTPISRSHLAANQEEPLPVAPDPVPFITDLYARSDRRGNSLMNVILALLILGCSAAGYFAVRGRVARTSKGQVQSATATSTAVGAATESLSVASVASAPVVPSAESLPVVPPPLQQVDAPGHQVQTGSLHETFEQPKPGGPRGNSSLPARLTAGRGITHSAGTSKNRETAPIVIESTNRVRTTPQTPPISAPEVTSVSINPAVNWIVNARTTVLPRLDKPKPPKSVGAVVVPPQFMKGTGPFYPAAAKKIHANGEVVVTATVNERGRPEDLKFVSGDEMFRQAAFDAVRRWKYRPGTYDGKPAGMPIEIRLWFSH